MKVHSTIFEKKIAEGMNDDDPGLEYCQNESTKLSYKLFILYFFMNKNIEQLSNRMIEKYDFVLC